MENISIDFALIPLILGAAGVGAAGIASRLIPAKKKKFAIIGLPGSGKKRFTDI